MHKEHRVGAKLISMPRGGPGCLFQTFQLKPCPEMLISASVHWRERERERDGRLSASDVVENQCVNMSL